MPDRFTPTETKQLARDLGAGDAPRCPRCKTEVGVRPVPHPPGVSYVRDRVWLTCPACGRNTVIDRRERP